VTISQADDIAETMKCVAQLVRLALPYRSTPQLGLAAKASGLSVGQVRMFLDGTFVPPPRQGISLSLALVEQERAGRAGYLAQIRQPFSGSDAGRGLVETTAEAVQAAVEQLRRDFPSWVAELPEGHESAGSDKQRLVWSAEHPDWGRVHAASSSELRDKLHRVEAHLAENVKRAARGERLIGRSA
jgi:hypothetical protein